MIPQPLDEYAIYIRGRVTDPAPRAVVEPAVWHVHPWPYTEEAFEDDIQAAWCDGYACSEDRHTQSALDRRNRAYMLLGGIIGILAMLGWGGVQ